MDASEFATKLGELAPEKSKLISAGYEDDEADKFIDTFQCVPREVTLHVNTHADQLLELMAGWDISHVEIGSLCFLSEPRVLRENVEVGSMESDSLVFRSDTKGYALVDHESGGVLCKVSRNGESLLDALLCIVRFYSKTAVDEIDIDDESEALKVKGECLSHLGGEEFETFCTTILGV